MPCLFLKYSSSYVFETGFLTESGVHRLTRCYIYSWQVPGILLSPPYRDEIIGLHQPYVAFYIGTGDLNSGP